MHMADYVATEENRERVNQHNRIYMRGKFIRKYALYLEQAKSIQNICYGCIMRWVDPDRAVWF